MLTPTRDLRELPPFAEMGLRFGFVNVEPEVLADYVYSWRTKIQGNHALENLDGGLAETIRLLTPWAQVNGMGSKYLIIGTQTRGWSAYFDNAHNGGEPDSTLELASIDLNRPSVLVCVRDFVPVGSDEPLGARQFWYLPGGGAEARSIEVIQESAGSHYLFTCNGPVQEWERPEQYRSRSKLDKFPLDMVAEYGQALGLRIFDVDFYTGPSIMISRA